MASDFMTKTDERANAQNKKAVAQFEKCLIHAGALARRTRDAVCTRETV
jgi:hypothetical protein